MEMKTEMNEDILALAQKRRAGRMATKNNDFDSFPKVERKRSGSFLSERILRIDNFTTGPESPSPAPSPLPFSHSAVQYGTNNFAEVAGREKNRRTFIKKSTQMFTDELPSAFSRNLLPPLINIEIQGEEIPALVNTSSHISLISLRLVNLINLRKDIVADKTVPPSPLSFGQKTPYLIEGKLRYVELNIKDAKHVTQLYVARDLPVDLVLGVDFLKKTQIRINFQESTVTVPSGAEEVKMPFLSIRELDHKPPVILDSLDSSSNRAYSSNF
ncbi:UNVERIFIED_CONTAM: hypothetical protein RMT77_012188 [Armadillidium vulgare]